MIDNRTHDELLLAEIPEDGSSIGNIQLMRNTGWDANKYWRVRRLLLDKGLITLGRGRGGSVRRVVSLPTTETTIRETEQPARSKEGNLYRPLARGLNYIWTRHHGFDNPVLHITARQGRRNTGGKWSRPDIAIVTCSDYKFVPGHHFYVLTFEVKPIDSIDVTAIYEALSHLRSATRAYVMFHVPEMQDEELSLRLSDIIFTAKSHGIGVITFTNPNDTSTWNDLVDATRVLPDPSRLNMFIATQFTEIQHKRIIKSFGKSSVL